MRVFLLINSDKSPFDDGNGFKVFETMKEAREAKCEINVECEIAIGNLEVVRLADDIEDE
jgi:hypothetical protein